MNFETVLAGTKSFATSFIPFLLTAASVIAGLWLIFAAISALFKKSSDSRGASQEMSYGGIAGRFLVGGLMLRFGATVEDLSVLITGAGIQDIGGVMAYAPMPQGAGPWQQVIEVCLLWVVMLGWAGAFRGLLLWNKAASGGGSGGSAGDLMWQGLWHLVGGALCVNMSGAIQAFVGS